jgi:cation:H+ antiporter
MLTNIALVIISFAFIWLASRLIIKTVCDLSHLLKLTPFAISFIVLGFVTSLPEFFISVSATIDHHPEIFAGTLMGASIVIFLFVIPLLSILGNGILIRHELKTKTLVFALFVVFLPFLCALDKQVERKEGIIMVIAWLILFYLIEKRQNFFHKIESEMIKKPQTELTDFAKIIFGAVIIYFSANVLVQNTIQIAGVLNISPFLISILLLALGTDLPETTVAIVSVIKKTKAIAMGDYLGSSAANTLIFGVLTIIHGNFSFNDKSFLWTYLLFAGGLIFFFFFARSRGKLSRVESGVLLLIYVTFIILKITN